jgi:hypothetical protein
MISVSMCKLMLFTIVVQCSINFKQCRITTCINETLTNERLIYIHLADRKTYDMNAQNSSSSDMKSIIQEFQSKVHSGDLNADLKDFSFEILSAK